MLKIMTHRQCPSRCAPRWLLALTLALSPVLLSLASAQAQGDQASPQGRPAESRGARGESNQPYVLDRSPTRNAHQPTSTAGATSSRGEPVRPDERRTPLKREADKPIPLLPPEDDAELSAPPSTSTGRMIWTVVSSLAVVLGLYFVVAMLSRRGAVGGPAPLPTEAFEVLGRAPLTGRQHAQVVRFGDKLILLCVSATGVDSLAEVTSVEEVERIAALCQQQRPDSVTQTFRQVLTQFSREPAPTGFVGEESAPSDGSRDEVNSEFERLA